MSLFHMTRGEFVFDSVENVVFTWMLHVKLWVLYFTSKPLLEILFVNIVYLEAGKIVGL